MSGAFSGLNLGLLGLDVRNLELICKGPFQNDAEERDARYALKILPIRRRGNYLLCTILLGNVTVNSGLAILMGDLTSGVVGLISSTAIITIFGEIIPQAVCSRYALVVGAHTTGLIYFFMALTFPISFPISAVLDKVLGEEVGNVLSKNQMKRMFEQLEVDNVIKSSERKIIQAALELQEKTAGEVMTPIEKVYMLDINTKFDQRSLREIYSKGYSRIPVYEGTRDNIVGILMARDLILINPDKALVTLKQMSSVIIRDVVAVGEADKLEPLLGYFKKGLAHIGVVTATQKEEAGRDYTRRVIGIVTLEDIIEEIIAEEIEDEHELMDEKQERRMIKEKLVMLFTDHEASKVLVEEEIRAVLEFLQKYVKPFHSSKIKRDVLNVLIRKSAVIEIESDEKPFSHVIDQFDNGANQRYTAFSEEQAMYNYMVRSAKEHKVQGEVEDRKKSQKINELKAPANPEAGAEVDFQPTFLQSAKLSQTQAQKQTPGQKADLSDFDSIQELELGANGTRSLKNNKVERKTDNDSIEEEPDSDVGEKTKAQALKYATKQHD